jgi:hypothetical protein
LDVVANVVEAQYELPDSAFTSPSAHLSNALVSGSISKFRDSTQSIKSVNQPYGSFGGSNSEYSDLFYTRVSERLRHKDRCVTPWDWQRVVLSHFPNINKVKCIPHAKPGSWSAPGNVMLVLVPDLTNQNAINPLQPRVDSNTLTQVDELVRNRVGGQTNVHVGNPRFQPIQIELKVRFHQGYEYNFYRDQLNSFISQTLSPWAFSSETNIEIEFGGRIYDSKLLKAIEGLEYVDYISDFAVSTKVDGVSTKSHDGMVRAAEPDVILVSSEEHIISKVIA